MSCSYYKSPRVSAEYKDCALPLTFDSYSLCSFKCKYCFSTQFKEWNNAYKNGLSIKHVNTKAISKLIRGENKTDPYAKYFFNRRFPLHWGGLSEPYCNFEMKNRIGLEILKTINEVQYPTVFSTKGLSLFLEDKDYMKIFDDASKYNNYAFQFSIVCNDDETSNKVEPNTPTTSERLKAMKAMSDRGYWTVLRLRPFIIGISDVDIEILLQRAKDNGCNAISMEFFAMDYRCLGGFEGKALKNIDDMSKLAGFDIIKMYKDTSPSERGGYLRSNRDVKEYFVKKIYIKCKELGLQFNISDPDFKELNQSGCCCFRGADKVFCRIMKDKKFVYKLSSFKNILKFKTNKIEIFLNGEWISANPMEIDFDSEWYHITLANGSTMVQTYNHLNFTLNGLKEASNLSQKDWLLFNNSILETNVDRGDYNTGRFIGWFLGDGCYNDKEEKGDISFFFDYDEIEYVNFIKNFVDKLGGNTKINDKKTYYILTCTSNTCLGILKDFILGHDCYTKTIKNSKIYNCSFSFRKGILDGWKEADGSYRKNLYKTGLLKNKRAWRGTSVNKKMIKDLFNLAISTGSFPSMRKEPKYNAAGSFENGKSSYLLSFLNPSNNPGNGGYKIVDNKVYVKIKNIKKYKLEGKKYSNNLKKDILYPKKAYCFFVESVHSFTLGNGVVTHNCGLPEVHPNKEISSFSRGQMTSALIALRKRYYDSNGQDKYLRYDDVYGNVPNNWMDEPRFYKDSLDCLYTNYEETGLGYSVECIRAWNQLGKNCNHYRYFHGLLKPSFIENDFIVYEYSPREYESRWKEEGII
jgi:DNA repair photolyase